MHPVETPTDLLLTGVRPLGGATTDVAIHDGRIAAIGVDASDSVGGHAEVLRLDGGILLPGFVDLHAHLRDPGQLYAESIATGSRAAALGGYTAICAMPNTTPAADSVEIVENIWRAGRGIGLVDVQPVGAVTLGRGGKRLAPLRAMAESQARVRMFSDDGDCVADPALMSAALREVSSFDGVIAQHAQDPRLTPSAQANDGPASRSQGLAGWPAVAEETIIARDIVLAAAVGARLHVCHVSTARSVEILRLAKAAGHPVTAEVTPHHLMLTDDLVETRDPVYKVNPPLRTAADVEACRAGLADGTIDCVATDHAPHGADRKGGRWEDAAFGMTGLETALSVVFEAMIETGWTDWPGLADRMSVAPARIAGLHAHGRELAAGQPATLVVIDEAARWTAGPDWASRSTNSPFAGRTMHAQVVCTLRRGRPTVRDRAVVLG
jgi:dihydroorotase